MEISATETVTVVPQGVTEWLGNVLEIVLLAGLENFVTRHAANIVKTDVTKALAAARRDVYLVTLEISVTKRAMIDVYLVVIRELTTVSIDFYLKKKPLNSKHIYYYLFFDVGCKQRKLFRFKVKPRQDSCTEILSILIGVCVVLCISVVVNGCTITW